MRQTPLLSAATLLVIGSLSDQALAFERQWHVGGGLGFAAFADGNTTAGPAMGLHGAYGLSDVFDIKLDLLTSTHIREDERFWVYSATAGLAYKLDIIEWVPYLGVQLGYTRLDAATPPGELQQNEPTFSVDLGVDYAVSRSFALGAQLRYHGFLSDPFTSLADAPLFTGLLRAEYRWGF